MARKRRESNNPVKDPYLIEDYTKEQVAELKKCSKDFIYFATTYCYIQSVKDGGAVLFKPFDYQMEMLNNFLNYKYLIALWGRQLGKTTLAALYILWRAIFHEEETILIAGNTLDSALEAIDRVKYSYEYLPYWLKPGALTYNRKNIIFENGSEIITRATTKNTGRGLSISLLYIDEMAMIDPPKKQKDFWSAIRPTLSTGGDCIITSTPISDEDTFAQIWYAANDTFDEHGNENPKGIGKNGFKAVKYTWDVHPDRDEAWRKQEEAAIGIDRFAREHECSFISDSDTLIDPIKLAILSGIDPVFKTSQVRWYDKPKPNKTYLVTLDPSLGVGGDYAAIQIFEMPEFIQIGEWQHNKTDPHGQVKCLRDILKYIHETMVNDYRQIDTPEIYWTIENNTIGEAANIVIKDTGEDNFPGQYITEAKKTRGTKVRRGFYTSNKSKLEACSKLKSYVEKDRIGLNSKPLISQLKSFVSRGASFRAKPGEHDDLISAVLLTIRLADNVKKFNEEIEKQLSQSLDEETEMPLSISILSTPNYNIY